MYAEYTRRQREKNRIPRPMHSTKNINEFGLQIHDLIETWAKAIEEYAINRYENALHCSVLVQCIVFTTAGFG